MKEIQMKDFDYTTSPLKLLIPEGVRVVASIHEHRTIKF